MSALLRPPTPRRRLVALTVGHLDAVLAVETAAYAFPWSRGNFIDSLAAGYPAQVLLDAAHEPSSPGRAAELIGYFVAMVGVDELHLLNLTVAPAQQGRGHARFLLDALVEQTRRCNASRLWLEVRASNARARRLYQRYGFRHVGMRRNYYPAPHGQREDAAVLGLEVSDWQAERRGDDALV